MKELTTQMYIPEGRTILTDTGFKYTLKKRYLIQEVIRWLGEKGHGYITHITSGKTHRFNKVRITCTVESEDTTQPRAPVIVEETDVQDNDTAVEGTHPCGRCGGTGRFVIGMENDKPMFGRGDCYRCAGKGQHTEGDRKRNAGYDAKGGLAA